MARARKPLGFLMALAVLFLPVLTAGSQETTRQDAVMEKGSEPALSSKIQITISGKELLDALQTDLKLMKQFGFAVASTGDSAVVTTDKLEGELTDLLEKARTLMRNHPGRIEIVHRDWNKRFEQIEQRFLPVEGSPVTGQMAYSISRMRGGGFAGGASGVTRGLDIIVRRPFTGNGYAYAAQDREHATQLERECHELATEYVNSKDGAKRAQLEAKLKDNLNELFDLKLNGFQEKIASIECELQNVRSQIAERKSNKELIVTTRFKELIGEDDHLQW